MINRSLGWMLVALGLGALHPIGASAQGDPSTPLPAGVTACKFGALVKPAEPGWWVIRDAPRQDGREVGRLPAIDNTRYLPEIQVIGFKDGWFLIEGAAYPELIPSQIYAGRGWVEGKSVTTHLFRDTLKKSPSNDSPDVSHLYGTDDPYRPYRLEVQRVLGCSGPWLEVEIDQPNAKTAARKACFDRRRNGARLDRQVLHETGRRSVPRKAVRLSLVAAAGWGDGMQLPRADQRSRPGRSQRTRRTGPKRSCPRPSVAAEN